MSVPILPVTSETHPSSRIPLKLSNPLPWTDCYVASYWGMKVRSPSLFTETPIDCVLSLEELKRHGRFLRADFAKQRAAAEMAANTTSARPEAPNSSAQTETAASEQDCTLSLADATQALAATTILPPAGCAHDQPDVNPSAPRVEIEPGSPTASLSPTGFINDNEMDEIFDFIFTSPALKQSITVNFSNDLSTVKELNHPIDYFKEVAAISRFGPLLTRLRSGLKSAPSIQAAAKRRLADATAKAIKAAADMNAELDERTREYSIYLCIANI
jgi:hypothetical protein